ncbi:AAA family ATPase [Cellulosimicrobium sp. BIT-GX5]|uniref:DNA 3'-5' helicase n=1 Tax=Cellulosimicrobium composti TaxID=2672572 RepID=A0A6N7ZKI8_9MICO|nr:ATP-dependent DNA helicase UvrD2 [Cellulosimicrobium composti]MTG89926.1 AAA family ATPase [Cellulosimicrobium composti]TWG83772.1 DNA helicase-2/ATP-dependent DNA helicase PcrA [Cellulosimicrobium cellulans J34]SMF45029.1 ATP-dependent DNA helicase, Rep family [Cellulosimicrobium cellulans J1]
MSTPPVSRPPSLRSADEILDALDPDQRDVAVALRGPVCVLAGAGTGKTRAITHRIAYGVRTGVYVPTSVLAVTFTARAAGEMRTRLRELGATGVQARTFHAAALRQLGYFWPKVVGGAPPRILEHKAPVIAESARRLGVGVDRVAVRDLSSEVEWAKVSLVTADDYVRACEAIDREPPAGYDHQTVARLITAYEDVKTERSVIDFEDVLLMLGDMLATQGGVADEVRRQYRHFVVDEYQDVSPLQQFVLDQWLGGRDELCVVGDPSQTIYSFTGATPHHLLTFQRTHPNAQVIRLVRDYRSTPQVVNLANQLLARAGRAGGAHQALELVAQRPAGPPVAFTAYDDDEAEATGIAQRISRLLAAGTRASEIAVLYRTNAQSEAFESALADAGIGYLVRGGERFFQRKEVRDAIVLLRGAARSADPDAPMPETVRDVLAAAGWAPEPPAARGAARERWESTQALVALADDLAALAAASDAPAPTVAAFVAELDERASAQHAPTVEGVTLASLHAAKGLEWDAVFLAGMSEGLMPISLAETDEAVAEERRLLYVGITRAREHLELSFARSRNPGGRATRRRTRFLDGLWPDEPGAHGPRRSRSGQAKVRLTGEYDQELFESLREWRRQVAEETDKPAFTVLVDTTLAAIAETRPTSTAALARISGLGPAKIERYGATILDIVSRAER